MILHPAIVALLLASVLVTFMVVYAAGFGARIVKGWDISSGSEEQLSLERGTYLISTLLACAFIFEMTSLFLYIYTADDLHSRFVGAMCAAGSLNVNPYGYPVFGLKVFNCILAGLWLIMNYMDNRGYDYPLIRSKFKMLMAIVPFVVAEAVLQAAYFLEMTPNIITSCCGSLFSAGQGSVPGGITALPAGPVMIAFYVSLVLVAVTGLRYRSSGRGGLLFSACAVAAFPVSALSLLSFISLYVYELPTHHCPFCILHREYWYIGYLLYGSLIGGVVFGAGVMVLHPFRHIRSLARAIPYTGRNLALLSVVSYLLFAGISTYQIAVSNLTLGIWCGNA